jgi:hypothetical protein
MNQPFSPLDLHPDGRLLTGLLRIFFWALVIIDNDNHRQEGGEAFSPRYEAVFDLISNIKSGAN